MKRNGLAMSDIKTIRRLRELLNQVYLTYSMTLKLSPAMLNKIGEEIDNAEPRIVETAILGNDIVIKPEPEDNRCVHTEHCCKLHGCKYGYDGYDQYGDEDETPRGDCPVAAGTKSQSFRCQNCNEEEENWYA